MDVGQKFLGNSLAVDYQPMEKMVEKMEGGGGNLYLSKGMEIRVRIFLEPLIHWKHE